MNRRIDMSKLKDREIKWRIDLIAVEFQGKKKISEKIIKKNLKKDDLEVVSMFTKL
jgi:hypothetical protein